MGSKQWISENWIEWNLIADKIPYSIFTYRRITETMFVYFTVDNDGSGIQALAFTGRLGFRSKKNDVDNNQSSNEEYPEDLFTSEQINTNWFICINWNFIDSISIVVEQRLKGAIFFHIFAAIYLFTLLAVVCNDYFLPSVECICEDLHIPQVILELKPKKNIQIYSRCHCRIWQRQHSWLLQPRRPNSLRM